jgi:hypothetical protein
MQHAASSWTENITADGNRVHQRQGRSADQGETGGLFVVMQAEIDAENTRAGRSPSDGGGPSRAIEITRSGVEKCADLGKMPARWSTGATPVDRNCAPRGSSAAKQRTQVRVVALDERSRTGGRRAFRRPRYLGIYSAGCHRARPVAAE